MRKLKPLPSEMNGLMILKDLGMNAEKTPKREAIFLCFCGEKFKAKINVVSSRHKKSCGCYRKSFPSHKAHNLSRHKLYRKWSGMITRTTNMKESSYKNYGGRGIIVCEEWRNDFMQFYEWSIKNGYKDGLTIDRINVNGNYEPSNCQWLTMKENTMKDRRSEFIKKHKSFEICELYKNEYITITEICKRYKTYKEVVSEILKENNIQIQHRRMKK